ncbi:hypothetical protein [Bradyrhizobium brasilense]|uniref:hypothetical protein n=1 Tax=Bradyrhizobium brasilense TaxID=1419277 RepID=UPI003D32354D
MNAREIIPVGDQVGEDADEERFLYQPGDDVVVGAPRPEERGQRHIDDDQRGGDEADLAAEQAESAVDVSGEDFKKMVDDAGAAHVSEPPAERDRPVSQARSDPLERFLCGRDRRARTDPERAWSER